MPRTAALLATAALAPALVFQAPVEASAYQKRQAAVYEEPGQRYMGVVGPGLRELGRFEFVSAPQAPGESLSAFMAKVRAAGPAEGPLYVFVPSYRFGTSTYTEPQISTERKKTGQILTTVRATVECPFTYAVEIYDARSGQLVDRLETTDTLTRRFETEYDQRYSDREVGYKRGLLEGRLTAEVRRAPEDAFADLAQRQLGSVRGWFQGAIRRMEAFQLRARVTGWDASKDEVALDMGRNFKIRLNDGFKLVRDGRELGYMRVVGLGAETSAVKPIFLDTRLQAGDMMIEYPKSGHTLGLKGGMIWLGGPALVGTFGTEFDFAPVFGGTDWFATLDLSGVTTGQAAGGMFELGLVRKLVWRRFALSLGLKPGLIGINDAASFGATAVTGLTVHLTPDIVAMADLGWAHYNPYLQQGFGSEKGRWLQPGGPVLKGGFSIAF